MLKRTVAGAALMAAALAVSAAPASAHAGPGAAGINGKVSGTVRHVQYTGEYPHKYRAWGDWAYASGCPPFVCGVYYNGYGYGLGWGYPSGFEPGYYSWGPRVGIGPRIGNGFAFR